MVSSLMAKNRAISVYIILLLITLGFIGFLINGNAINQNDIEINGRNQRLPNTIIVDCNGNGDYTTIQDAIDNATLGDTIRVWAGIYYENVIVNKTVTLIGNSSETTTIDGSGSGDVVYVSANWVNVSEFRIINSGSHWPTIAAGIKLYHVENLTIKNNKCINNDHGIWLSYSKFNTIGNNTCNSNNHWGIYLGISHSNMINNNNCSTNLKIGIEIFRSNFNIVNNNICNSNIGEGIDIGLSFYNTVINNFCFNNGYGIRLEGASNNHIYHNNIISNTIQAADDGTNYWNNSAHEGNYWDDYDGEDNGADGRVKGDGIGDTELPHLNLDNYPFTKQNGWLYPGIPNLHDPGYADNDGNYKIIWNGTVRAIGYILEEDDNNLFTSPEELYNGSGLNFDITGRAEGTYYYRAKAYNEQFQSEWSDIVDIIVHPAPSIPKDLQVNVYPSGNALNLSWAPNLKDTKEYILEYKNETMSNWISLNPVPHPAHTFNHTELVDGIKYDYQVQAKNYLGQVSEFSNIVSGVPADSVSPAPPTGLKVISITLDTISLTWKSDIVDDLKGFNIYRSKIENPSNWGEPINENMIRTIEYIDTNLKEYTTYYYVVTALDEVPNESDYSEIISGTTLLGPHPPEINNSIDDFEILEDTTNSTSINLYRWFKDINNDPLSFRYEGNKNISITIHQNNGTVILIPKKNWNGQETITFYANDSSAEISDSVTITVTAVNDPPTIPEIITPNDGYTVDDKTPIDFSGNSTDPDLLYGDKLTFTWKSNISGKIGVGKNLTNIILEPGYHLIILEVSDSDGETSSAAIRIIVNEKDDSSGDQQGNMNIIIMVVVVIILIVIFASLLMVYFKKEKPKKTNEKEKNKTSTQPKSTLQEKVRNPQQSPRATQEQKYCSSCGQALKYFQQNNRYYCGYCNKNYIK